MDGRAGQLAARARRAAPYTRASSRSITAGTITGLRSVRRRRHQAFADPDVAVGPSSARAAPRKVRAGLGGAESDRPNRVDLATYESTLVGMVRQMHAAGAEAVLITAASNHVPGAEPQYLGVRHLRHLQDLSLNTSCTSTRRAGRQRERGGAVRLGGAFRVPAGFAWPVLPPGWHSLDRGRRSRAGRAARTLHREGGREPGPASLRGSSGAERDWRKREGAGVGRQRRRLALHPEVVHRDARRRFTLGVEPERQPARSHALGP